MVSVLPCHFVNDCQVAVRDNLPRTDADDSPGLTFPSRVAFKELLVLDVLAGLILVVAKVGLARGLATPSTLIGIRGPQEPRWPPLCTTLLGRVLFRRSRRPGATSLDSSSAAYCIDCAPESSCDTSFSEAAA